MDKMQIGVIFGSRSCEHEVSDHQRAAVDESRRSRSATI